MNRFLGTFAMALLLLGSVALCQYAFTREVQVSVTRTADKHAPAPVAAEWTLEVTTGFRAGQDPFALQASPAAELHRLLVRHEGRSLLRETADLERGAIRTVGGLRLAGTVARFYAEATPAPEDAELPCALRLRLLQDGQPCGEGTVWSAGGGAPVSGEVDLSLAVRGNRLDRGLAGNGDDLP